MLNQTTRILMRIFALYLGQVPTMEQGREDAKEKQEKEKKRLQQYDSSEPDAPMKPTKWYMGEYANSDGTFRKKISVTKYIDKKN